MGAKMNYAANLRNQGRTNEATPFKEDKPTAYRRSESPCTWFSVIERNAIQTPEKKSIIDGSRILTCRALYDRVQRLIRGFTDLGIQRGDIVSIWLPNCLEWVETAAALAGIGATALAINTKLRSHDITGILQRSRSDVIITSAGFKGIDFLAILREIVTDNPDTIRTVVIVPGTSHIGHKTDRLEATTGDRHDSVAHAESDELQKRGFDVISYCDLVNSHPQSPPCDDPDLQSNAITSSGSTGVPKIILHTQAGLFGHSTAVARRYGYFEDSTVVLVLLPLCGVFGLNTLLAAIIANKPVVMQAAFNAEEAVDLIDKWQVTNSNMSDSMASMVLDAGMESDSFRSLREIAFGNFTAADVHEILQKGESLGIKLFQTYGSSEAQALLCYPSDDADGERYADGGGVHVAAETEIRIRQLRQGETKEAAPKERGEIEIRSPFLSPARITERGREETPLDNNGWFSTGDLGYMLTSEDFVYLSRMGDALRLGGFLVSPREVEDFLITIPAVHEAQYVAIDGPNGLVPFAFVTSKEPTEFDESAAIAACRASLARFKIPARIILLERFPTIGGANGEKIQRGVLRDMAKKIAD
jgi:fatty-acyl-CoA synthase